MWHYVHTSLLGHTICVGDLPTNELSFWSQGLKSQVTPSMDVYSKEVQARWPRISGPEAPCGQWWAPGMGCVLWVTLGSSWDLSWLFCTENPDTCSPHTLWEPVFSARTLRANPSFPCLLIPLCIYFNSHQIPKRQSRHQLTKATEVILKFKFRELSLKSSTIKQWQIPWEAKVWAKVIDMIAIIHSLISVPEDNSNFY